MLGTGVSSSEKPPPLSPSGRRRREYVTEGVKHSYRNEDGELEYASDETLMATIAREYAEKGYPVPRIVFWNVNSRSGAIPMRENSAGLILVSGFSRSLIELACSNELDLYNALIKVLDGERYLCVRDEIVVS